MKSHEAGMVPSYSLPRLICRLVASAAVPAGVACCASSKPAASAPEPPPAIPTAPVTSEPELELRDAELPALKCDLSKARKQEESSRYCDAAVFPLPECLPSEAIEEDGQLTAAWCRTVCVGASKCYLTSINDGVPAVACESCATVGRRPAGLEASSAPPTPLSLGRFLALNARLEAAAVWAFRQLRRELAAHGAPRRLLVGARRAARDEVRHARITARLANHRGEPVEPPRMRRPKPDRSLLEIAIENVEEGCVRETYAAAVATWQATHAADSDVRAAMGSIARDERRHAALSWSVAAWLEGKLSGDERRQVHLARAGAIAALSESVESAWPNEMALKAGLPSAAEGRRLLAELRSSLWRD